MTYQVIQPPKDETVLAETGKEIVQAGRALGMHLDAEGFLYAWVQGLRVIVERNEANAIVSMAMLTVGKRWTNQDVTGSILAIAGDREPLIEFIKQVCASHGASTLFVEQPFPVQKAKHKEITVMAYELS